MKIQPQTASADYRLSSDMAHHVQQLQQAGFDDGQVRALASFVSGVVRDTMRPFIERVDQRFDAADQRVDRVETRLDNLEQRAGGLGENLARLDAKVEDVWRREWVGPDDDGLGVRGHHRRHLGGGVGWLSW